MRRYRYPFGTARARMFVEQHGARIPVPDAEECAKQITKLTGAEVDELDLDGFEPVPEVQGRADAWWRGPDSLVAVYRGESVCLDEPRIRTARIYSGLKPWDLIDG
jgi:hypothetical protein